MPSASQSPARAVELADTAIATVRGWLADVDAPEGATPRRLPARRPRPGWSIDEIVADPAGREFAVSFVDGVIRPDDHAVAARHLERLSRDLPTVLPMPLRVLVQLAGGFAVLAPRLVVPLTRAAFRRSVRHLVLDGEPKQLARRVAELRGRGLRLSLTPLGETVHGLQSADRRLAAAMDLLRLNDVDSISVPLSAIAGPTQPWAHEVSVERIVERLAPLYEFAATSPTTKRIVLETEGRAQFDLTVDVFTALLERPALGGYEAGITLPASLSGALPTLQRLTAWATERRIAGRSGITVHLANVAAHAADRVDAEVHGRTLAGQPTRLASDSNFMRLIDWALTPQRIDAVRIVVATGNLFELALAWHLAETRGVSGRVAYEMPLGASPHLDAVKRDLGTVLLTAPVVATADFEAASRHLIARFEARSNPENAPAMTKADAALFDREADALRRALRESEEPPVDGTDTTAPSPRRSDPAEPDARQWARGILARSVSSTAGTAQLEQAIVRDTGTLDGIVATVAAAGAAWAARPAAERATALDDVAEVLDAMRGRLIETLISETGALFSEADAEARGAVALVRAAAGQAGEADSLENAAFVPAAVTLVAPGWSSAVTDTVEAVCAALAAGGGVIVQPAHQARRATAVVIEALAEAGIPTGLAALVVPEDANVAKAAVAHPEVDRVVFTGDRDTAMLLRSWRPDRPPFGDVRGTAAHIVTESADLDLAVTDIVRSAFTRGGQHPHGARLVILVGAMGQSNAFRRRLADAVRSTHPAPATEATSRMGPLIATPPERVRRLLARVEGGETWLVEPEALDDRLTVWRPGVRDGVAAEVALQRTVAAPAIVLTAVADLESAIELQNAGRGETAGIHTHDIDELAAWLDSVEAPGLFVNRPTVGAAVDTLPSGGWHGAGGMRGGPDRVFALGDWAPVFAEAQQSVRLDGIGDRVRILIEAAQPAMQFLEFDLVRAGAVSDEHAWSRHYGTPVDLTGLQSLRNVVRHLPVESTIRLAEGVSTAQLIRVLAAATRAGAPVAVSTATPLPEVLVQLFTHPLTPLQVSGVLVESDARWHARVQSGEVATPHIRLIGGDGGVLATVLARRPDVALYAAPVTTSGRLELLPFLRAQVVSMAAHRYGMPDAMIAQIEF